MSKGDLIFKVPLNVLLADDGTKEKLIAIAYYRGQKDKYAGPVRDGLAIYVKEFRDKLPPAERKRFDQILDHVKLTASMQKQIKKDSSSG